MPSALQRQLVGIEVRHDLAIVEAVAPGEPVLQLDAFGHLAVDIDLYQAFLVGAGDQAVRLEAGEAEPLGHLGLRQAAGIVQPGGARRHAGFVVAQEGRFQSRSFLP